MQWAANKLRWNLRTWRRIYWSEESRFLLRFTDGRVRVWRRRGHYPFRDNVDGETEMFGGGSIMVSAALVMTTRLISRLLDKLWQGNVTLTISPSLLCIHIPEHIKQHAPYFTTTMPVHIRHVLLQILLHRRGFKIFSGRAGALIWIPSNTFWTVWDVTSANEMTSSRLMTLYVHLSTSGTIWSPVFLDN